MEKTYYWLKLEDAFFTDKPMLKIRTLAGGDTFMIIYFLMLLAAIKQGGRLYYDGVQPTFEEEIALQIREKPEDVKNTVNFLKEMGLIEQVSDSEIELVQCAELAGSETGAARRQRVCRQRKKEAIESEEIPEEKEEPTEEAVEEEKVVEKPKRKKAESCIEMYERIISEYAYDEVLKEKVHDWMEYKAERHEKYQERGMKVLLNKIRDMTMQYGVGAVCSLIDTCMANTWKGIIWDILEKGKQKSTYIGKIENRVSSVDEW